MGSQPFHVPLFTEVPRRGILGSSPMRRSTSRAYSVCRVLVGTRTQRRSADAAREQERRDLRRGWGGRRRSCPCLRPRGGQGLPCRSHTCNNRRGGRGDLRLGG